MRMRGLQWDPQQGRLAAPENTVRILELGQLQSPPAGRTALVSTIESDRAGARLATAGVQKIVRVFDARAFIESVEGSCASGDSEPGVRMHFAIFASVSEITRPTSVPWRLCISKMFFDTVSPSFPDNSIMAGMARAASPKLPRN